MKKFLFCLLLVISLIFVSSCNKKESENTETKTEVSTVGETALNGSGDSFEAIKVTQMDEDIPEISVEEKTPLELTSEDKNEEENEDFEINEFYRGGELLVKASLKSESASIKFNVEDDEILKIISKLVVAYPEAREAALYTLSDSLVELSYSRLSEDEVEEYWSLFKAFLNSYNEEKASLLSAESGVLVILEEADTVKGTLKANIYSDKVELFIPEGLEVDYEEIVTSLLNKYSFISSYLAFEVKDGEKIVLSYIGEFSNRDAALYFDELSNYIDEYYKEEIKEEDTKASTTLKTAEDAGSTEKKEKFKRISISLGFNNSYDTKIKYAPLCYGGVDYYFSSNFAIGLKAGYDFTGFIPLSLSLRLYAPGLEGLFIQAEGGVKLGLKENKDIIGLLGAISLGYEINITDSIRVFTEAGTMYATKKEKSLRYGLTIGARFAF